MHEATQITYGDGIVNIIMNTESMTEVAAPEIRLGDYSDTLTACFTRKELDAIEAGDTAELVFNFTMVDELTDRKETAIFEKAIAREEKKSGKLEKGMYFRMEATKSVAGEEAEEMNAFYDNIEYQLQLPLYLVREERSYYAMTNVLGVCELALDEDGEADTFTVTSNDIGTTLILYQEGDTSTDPEIGSGFSGTYIILAGIVALVIAWFRVDHMHKKQ